MFESLARAISDRLRQHGISSAVEAAQVTEVLRQIIAEKWGASGAAAMKKVALREGATLEILAGSGGFAAELRMHEFYLQEQLSARCNGRRFRLRIFG